MIIYILNYLVNREVSKKKGDMTTFFVDLKAAFDSVNRDILMNTMREKGIEEGLVYRYEEVLKETRYKVRMGGDLGENF